MKLILFDIDGTLIWPDGAGRAAMYRALSEVYGTTGLTDSLPMAGKTDWQIISELLSYTGIGQSHMDNMLPECFKAIAHHMAQTTQERRILSCPGVPALLRRLSGHPEAMLGLLTGNVAAAAPIKLRAAGLDPAIFCVGAYGNDRRNRSQLPGLAIARAHALTGHMVKGKDVVIVGDTPADVTCGRHLGVTAIGVATGSYVPEALVAAGADCTFPDLTDTDAVTQAIL
jgi:phosphoglycolate phosphatase-like HAD superfamily hydrolase